MKVRHKAHVRWALLILCTLAFTVFLAACGTSTSSTATGPTPTPTPSGTTYNGNGYTLSYPQGWTVNSTTPTTAVFTNTSDPTANLTISVTPITPITSLNTSFSAAETLLKSNSSYQQVTTDLPTTSIGGDTWQETGGTYNNGIQIKGAVLGDQHPATTGSIFIITLTDKADSYDQTYSAGFQPMLQSFHFTS